MAQLWAFPGSATCQRPHACESHMQSSMPENAIEIEWRLPLKLYKKDLDVKTLITQLPCILVWENFT